jgi:hypothetical protein
MPCSYALVHHGRTLATRPFAKRLRAEVIEEANGYQLVELDFSDVLSVSHSFADEFVAQLAEESQAGDIDFRVAVTNAAPNVEARISKALELRGVQLFELA